VQELAAIRHPPDVVERLLDGGQEHDGGDRQKQQADSGEPPGLARQLGKILLHHLTRGRHEVAVDEILNHGHPGAEPGRERQH